MKAPKSMFVLFVMLCVLGVSNGGATQTPSPTPIDKSTTKANPITAPTPTNAVKKTVKNAPKNTPKHASGKDSTGKDTTADQPSSGLISVKISTSRKEVTLDGAYGIIADVENLGAVPITLYANQTILVVEPEVTQSNNCAYGLVAFLPTAFAPGSPNQPGQKVIPLTDPYQATDPRGLPIQIQPKEHYSVFWDINRSKTTDTTCEKRRWYDVFSFVPGEYPFVLDAKIYLAPDQQEETVYHTITERTVLRVSITQLTAMLAAMIGAIIAYVVTALRPDKEIGKFRESGSKLRATLVISRNLFSAALMGATITIVASRLADTQFPVKVSVNDFWGAVTIGFVSYFVGNKFIDKLVGTVPQTPLPHNQGD